MDNAIYIRLKMKDKGNFLISVIMALRKMGKDINCARRRRRRRITIKLMAERANVSRATHWQN